MDELIDTHTSEVTQPEAWPSYPKRRNIDTIEQLVELGGEIIGYEKEEPVWNPIIVWDTPYPAEVGKSILEKLDNNKFNSPGITCYLTYRHDSDQSSELDNMELWGVLFIEDWYEECIDYRSMNLSRGDPSAWGVITGHMNSHRERIKQIMDEHSFIPVNARDCIKDHPIALFGQAQLFYIEATTFQSMTNRVEKGNPDYPHSK